MAFFRNLLACAPAAPANNETLTRFRQLQAEHHRLSAHPKPAPDAEPEPAAEGTQP